jgi:hypothetical protein
MRMMKGKQMMKRRQILMMMLRARWPTPWLQDTKEEEGKNSKGPA